MQEFVVLPLAAGCLAAILILLLLYMLEDWISTPSYTVAVSSTIITFTVATILLHSHMRPLLDEDVLLARQAHLELVDAETRELARH